MLLAEADAAVDEEEISNKRPRESIARETPPGELSEARASSSNARDLLNVFYKS